MQLSLWPCPVLNNADTAKLTLWHQNAYRQTGRWLSSLIYSSRRYKAWQLWWANGIKASKCVCLFACCSFMLEQNNLLILRYSKLHVYQLMMETKVVQPTKGITTLIIMLMLLALPPSKYEVASQHIPVLHTCRRCCMLRAQEIICTYTHCWILMLSLHISCWINQIHDDNLWLQFDTNTPFHFIYLTMKLLMKYIWLLFKTYCFSIEENDSLKYMKSISWY